MNINLLPWRERKKQRNNKLMLQYAFIFLVFIFFAFVGIQYSLSLELESIKKQNSILGSRFSSSQIGKSKRLKTEQIISFLYNLPIFIQDGMYANRILVREDLIALNVSVSEISKLEKFIQKIKKQEGIKKISIDSSTTHGRFDSENRDHKFMITFYLDNSESISL